MGRFAFRAMCITMLTGCIDGSRISPKGVGNGNEVVGTSRTGQLIEEGDAMMLLQGVRGVNVHHGDADIHGSQEGVNVNHGDAHIHGRGLESKHSRDVARPKEQGDSNKHPEAHSKKSPPILQIQALVSSWSFNSTGYVSVIQTLLHRHVQMNAGLTAVAILFAMLVIVVFMFVLAKNVTTNQLFGNGLEKAPKEAVREPLARDAFFERTQAVSPPQLPNLRKPSPIQSTFNVPSASARPSMLPLPRTSGLYQPPAQQRFPFEGSKEGLAGQPADMAAGHHFSDAAIIPPLCPKMSMPACEARFLIPRHAISMLAEGGALKIVGLSGSALFQATVRTVKDYRLLEMSLCSDLATCATIRLDNPEAPSGAVIRGEGGAFYGILETRSDGSCEVTRDDSTLMFIEADTDTLTLSLTALSGQTLATVTCMEHVDIKISQGQDIVLLISCILAVLIQSAPPNF